jgi:hypothetical protein
MPAFFHHVDGALTRAGESITGWVGTMWCALLFAVIALTGLPAALQTGTFILWLSGAFCQLVLLPIIMVGQNMHGAKTEAVIERIEALTERIDALLEGRHE